MEISSKIQRYNRSLTNWIRADDVRSVALAGLVATAILGGVTGLNLFAGLIGAFFLLLLVLAVPQPILIVYGLTLVFPLLGGFARGAGIPFLRPGQALLVVGFLLFVLAKRSQLGKSRLTVIDLIFVLFFMAEAVFPVLDLLYRGEPLALNTPDTFSGTTGLQVLLGPIQYYLLYRIIVATVSSERQIKMVLNLSFIASIIVSFIGILQELNVGPVRTFLNTYYPSINVGNTDTISGLRISSTLEGYSGLAAYLCFVLILALACYTTQRHTKISMPLLSVTFLFDSVALVLTGTFTAWFGLAIGAIVIFKLTGRVPKLVIFVVIAIILTALIFYPFISSRFAEWSGGGNQGLLPTYAERIRLWNDLFLPTIGHYLWFGAGPAPEVSAYWPSEETQYLYLLLHGGLLFFFSYILLMGAAIAKCWRQIKSRSKSIYGTVAIALLAILITLNIMNVSAEYFTMVGGTQIIWILLGIVVASGQLEELEAPYTTQRIIGRKQRVASTSFARPLDITGIATSTKPISRNSPAKEENSFVSTSLIPYYARPIAGSLGSPGLGISRRVSGHQRFGWLERWLDWRFVKDSVVVGAGSTISRVLGLLFQTMLAHFLVPDDFGFFRYVVTVSTIIAIAATAAPVSIARFLAANPDEKQVRDSYFSNGMVGIVLLLIATVLISIPLLWLLHALDLGAISCIVGFAAFYGYLAIVRGLNSAWKMGLTYAVSNIALIVVLLVCVDFFKLRSVSMALMIYGLSNIVPIIVLECIRPMVLRFKLSLISKSVLLELAHFAAPLLFATGVYTIWTGIDVVFVENFAPHAVGAYAVAKTVSSAFIFVPSAITMVLLPRVAALGPDKSKLYTAGAASVAFLTSMIGLAIIYVWGHQLIGLAFGGRYSDAYLPLLIQSIGMSIYSVYAIIEGYIIGSGRPSLSVQALTVALVTTVVTGFWLTSSLGAVGASIAFTIGAAIATGVLAFNTYFFLRRDKQAVSKSDESSVTN